MSSSSTRDAGRRRHEPHVARLLARVADGDRSAFVELYDGLAPAVLRISRPRCGTDAAAELLLQEVFLQIWCRAPAFPVQSLSAMSWIVQIVDRTVATTSARRDQKSTRPGEPSSTDSGPG